MSLSSNRSWTRRWSYRWCTQSIKKTSLALGKNLESIAFYLYNFFGTLLLFIKSIAQQDAIIGLEKHVSILCNLYCYPYIFSKRQGSPSQKGLPPVHWRCPNGFVHPNLFSSHFSMLIWFENSYHRYLKDGEA